MRSRKTHFVRHAIVFLIAVLCPLSSALAGTAISDRIALRFRSTPRGVMDLQHAQTNETVFDPSYEGWTNPHTKGLRLRSDWNKNESNTSQGVYLYTYLDSAIALAQPNNKQLGYSITLCQAYPSYIVGLGAVVVTLSSGPTVMPWDPVVVTRHLALIDALGAHYDGKIAYWVIGGLGRDDSTNIAHDDSDAALCDANAPGGDGLAAWQTMCDTIIARYVLRFPHTPLIINAAGVYAGTITGPAGSDALQAMTDRIKAKYPQVGFMNTSLTAHPGGNNLPYQLVFQNPDRPTGAQFISNSFGFGGVDLGGSVLETFQAGAAEKAHFCESYAVDNNNPVYWPDLDWFNDNAP